MSGVDRRPTITIFNRSYWPDTGATGQLLTELAEDLVNRHGFDVTVVSGYPDASPAGGRPPAREVRAGVTIHRAAGTTWSKRRFVGRSANYLTYFLSAVWAAVRLPRPDLAIAMTDPPMIGLAALASRPRRGLVFYCQDIFPEVAHLLEDFRSPTLNAVLDALNRFLVRRARRVIALGDTMKRRLVEGKGADPSRVTIVHNWADTSAIVPSDKHNAFSTAHGLDGQVVVLHAGNIGLSQNLDLVIEAADRLKAHREIVFLFIGDGSRRSGLESEVASRGLSNVRFLPFQPRADLRWTYASSDMCLISLKPGLAGYIVPSKLYPILAAGRPYVAAVDADSEVAAITADHGGGIVVPPGDAGALAGAIEALAGDPARRASLGARAHAASAAFARDRQVGAVAQVLRDVLAAT